MSERHSPGSSASNVSPSELAGFFERAIGEERAAALVVEVCGELGFGPGPLSPEQARSALDRLTRREGLIGIVAGFALARLHFARTVKAGKRSGDAP